jgi:integrase
MKRSLNEVRFVLKDIASVRPTLIYLIYRFGGQRLKYSTGEKVNPVHWDSVLQRIKIDTKDRASRQSTKDSNTQLDRYESKVLELRRSFELSGLPLTPDLFRVHLDKEFKFDARLTKSASRHETFIEFAQRFIDEAKVGTRLIRRKNKRYSPETLKTHQTTVTNLLEFSKDTVSNIDFEHIDIIFHQNFIAWLANKKSYASNSIGNQIKHIKAWLRAAGNEGLHQNRSFESDEFNKPNEETVAIYLNDSELNKIFVMDLSNNRRLDSVRDLFMIGCYTGLRFSDFNQLRSENIIADGTILQITTQKTQTKVFIPINPKVNFLLKKYDWSVPRTISNQKMNDYIKELGKKAGIEDKVEITMTKGGKRVTKYLLKYEVLSTHTARRSFATNAYLGKVPPIDIMRITGHKTETSFMKYIKVTGEETALRMLNHDHFKKSAFSLSA